MREHGITRLYISIWGCLILVSTNTDYPLIAGIWLLLGLISLVLYIRMLRDE